MTTQNVGRVEPKLMWDSLLEFAPKQDRLREKNLSGFNVPRKSFLACDVRTFTKISFSHIDFFITS